MTQPTLHPWLSTPDAIKAARAAVRIPQAKLPKAAEAAGTDELFSEALAILTDCALPPRERGHFACVECGGSLENVRAGAKFCSVKCNKRHGVRRLRAGGTPPAPARDGSHVGSMWSWPEDQMHEYAARQIGMVLCNWLRTRPRETPSTPGIENANAPAGIGEPEAREVLEDFLTAYGVQFEGDESLDDLAEAAAWIRGGDLTALAALVEYGQSVEVAA